MKANSPDIKIRRPSVADLPQMNDLILAAKSSWGYAPELIALWKPILEVTEANLQQRVCYIGVDAATEKPAWLYSVKALELSESGVTSEIRYELDDCWMSPEYMGLGLGAKLFAHLVGYLRAEAIDAIRIVSDPNAEGFYLKMGAVKVGEKPSTPAGRMLPILVCKPN